MLNHAILKRRTQRGARPAVAALYLGLALTLYAALFAMDRPGVWYGQVNVLFHAPISDRYPNSVMISSDSLITVAGLVQKSVDVEEAGVATVSEDVELPWKGVRSGTSVTFPNAGGQYADNYNEARLDVEVVGPTRTEVTTKLNAVLTRIDQETLLLQTRAGTAPNNLITTGRSPGVPTVTYQSGSRVRAGAATVVLGVGLSLALYGVIRRRSGREVPTDD